MYRVVGLKALPPPNPPTVYYDGIVAAYKQMVASGQVKATPDEDVQYDGVDPPNLMIIDVSLFILPSTLAN